VAATTQGGVYPNIKSKEKNITCVFNEKLALTTAYVSTLT
jgi:hypothetical protein